MKKTYNFSLSLVFLSLSFTFAYAQNETVNQKLKIIPEKYFDETIIKIAKSFLGKPYVAATLEGGNTEKLVCNLEQLDCFTYVDQVLALALTIQDTKSSESEFLNILQKNRYKNGKLSGYVSRLHYFSDWAKQAEKNGILDDIGKTAGIPFKKLLNFMGTHRNSYTAFKTDDMVWYKIKAMEGELNKNQFYYIPKTNLSQKISSIKNGDIIAFTSSVDGLDVNHEGFAYWDKNELKFYHASLEEKKVVLSKETVQSYLNRIKKHTGIMVYRPIFKSL